MYHFVGIKQTEMSALSQIIHSLGYKVSGSDQDKYAPTQDLLEEKGIRVFPFSINNIHDDMIIVQGENVSDENIEIVKATELGLKIYSCGQMIKRFTEMFQTVAVSGCIGKQVTTEMMAYVLTHILGCNYMLSDGRGYAHKENKYLCVEASENNSKFLDYSSYYAIITNIDLSYTNYYSTIDEVINAYEEFGNRAEKMVLACGDDRYTHLLNVNEPIFYYGLNEDNDVIAKEVEYTPSGTSFEVEVEDNYYGNFELPIYGKQMLLNVLSVISICYYERIEAKYVSKALKEYFESKKVLEEKQFDDIVTVNLLANHPNEIKATVKALKQKYPSKKIASVFEPNQLLEETPLISYFIDTFNLFEQNYIIMDNKINKEEFADVLDKIENKEYLSANMLDELGAKKDIVFMFINKKKVNFLQSEFERHLAKGDRKKS